MVIVAAGHVRGVPCDRCPVRHQGASPCGRRVMMPWIVVSHFSTQRGHPMEGEEGFDRSVTRVVPQRSSRDCAGHRRSLGRLLWASPALPGAAHDVKAARTQGAVQDRERLAGRGADGSCEVGGVGGRDLDRLCDVPVDGGDAGRRVGRSGNAGSRWTDRSIPDGWTGT